MTISSSATGLRPGVCLSSNRPTAPYTGQIIYETDTGYLRVWDGSSWDYLSKKQDISTWFNATSGSSSGESSSINISTKPWNLPWGLVSFGTFTSGSSVSSFFTTTNMPTVTFTAVANRYYKITWYEPEVVANGYNYLELRQTNATGTLLSRAWADVSGEGVAMTIMAGPLTFSAGSVTLVTVLNTSGNGFCTRGASEVARLIVEDIGPA